MPYLVHTLVSLLFPKPKWTEILGSQPYPATDSCVTLSKLLDVFVPPFPTCTIEMLLFRPVCLEGKAGAGTVCSYEVVQCVLIHFGFTVKTKIQCQATAVKKHISMCSDCQKNK